MHYTNLWRSNWFLTKLNPVDTCVFNARQIERMTSRALSSLVAHFEACTLGGTCPLGTSGEWINTSSFFNCKNQIMHAYIYIYICKWEWSQIVYSKQNANMYRNEHMFTHRSHVRTTEVECFHMWFKSHYAKSVHMQAHTSHYLWLIFFNSVIKVLQLFQCLNLC